MTPAASLVTVVLAVSVLSCGADTQTRTQTDADERYTPATAVGVSNACSPDTSCISTCIHLYPLSLSRCILHLYRRQNCR